MASTAAAVSRGADCECGMANSRVLGTLLLGTLAVDRALEPCRVMRGRRAPEGEQMGRPVVDGLQQGGFKGLE